MFCPRCATSNTDEAKFCRSCGANLSLVPQALSGQLHAPDRRHEKEFEQFQKWVRRRREPSLARGFSSSAMGIAFMLIAIGLWVSREWWGLWMLIPGFAMLGKGIGMILSSRESRQIEKWSAASQAPPQIAPNTGHLNEAPRPEIEPPSVTEQTTRHLDAPVRQPDGSG